MRNVHERHIAASAARVGAVLETLSTDDDQLWPGHLWGRVVLDRGLEPGSTGGHDGVGYTVTAHEPGRRVEMTFTPETGIRGTHVFEVGDLADGTARLRHTITGRTHGWMLLLWPLVVRWAHDALLEDALDRAERSLGVGPARPATRSAYIRTLRWLRQVVMSSDMSGDVCEIQTPAELLTAAGLERVDFADTFSLRLPPGTTRDVDYWHDAIVAAGTPAWISGLMRVRCVVARMLRLSTSDVDLQSGFARLSRSDDLLVVGADDRHLDFRAVLRLQDSQLEVATVVEKHNAIGRAYFAVVKPFHRRVVPAMLRRAALHATLTTPHVPAGDHHAVRVTAR